MENPWQDIDEHNNNKKRPRIDDDDHVRSHKKIKRKQLLMILDQSNGKINTFLQGNIVPLSKLRESFEDGLSIKESFIDVHPSCYTIYLMFFHRDMKQDDIEAHLIEQYETFEETHEYCKKLKSVLLYEIESLDDSFPFKDDMDLTNDKQCVLLFWINNLKQYKTIIVRF